jgi:MFS family permease
MRLVPVLIVTFCVMLGTGMMFPLLTLLSQARGYGPTGAGILLSCFAVARLATNLPAGHAADRIGRRVVLAVGLALLVGGSLIGFGAHGVWQLSVAILLIGAGSSAALTAAAASISDRATDANRGVLMSRYQTAVLVGISFGPVTGGVIAENFGLQAPFLLQAAMATLALGLAATFRSTRGKGRVTAAPEPFDPAWRLFAHRSFALVCLLSFMLFLTRTATNWQIVPILGIERFGMSAQSVGFLLTSGALSNLVMQPVIGPMIDRWGAGLLTAFGAAAVIGSFLIVAAASSEPWLYVAVIVMGIGSGILSTANYTYALENSTAGRGSTIGMLRTAGDSGLVLGPLLLGPVLAMVGLGHEPALVISALALGLVTIAFMVNHLGARRR